MSAALRPLVRHMRRLVSCRWDDYSLQPGSGIESLHLNVGLPEQKNRPEQPDKELLCMRADHSPAIETRR